MYSIDSYDSSWERRLDVQYQKHDRCKKRAYICSPLSAEDDKQQMENMRLAREYMLYVYEKLGYLARAPHAYLPMLLCDQVPAERALALQFGIHLLEQSELLLVCGARISNGMTGEILHAAKLGIPIRVYNEDMLIAVRKLATQAGASKKLVTLDRDHPVLEGASPLSECVWEAMCLA